VSDNPHGLVLPPELNPRGKGAVARPHTRGRRVARILSWIAVGLSASTLLLSGVGFALIKYYDGNINRLDGLFGEAKDRPAKLDGKAKNFLLVGSDSREGASKEELRQSGTEFTPGRRSDTMILIHLSAKQDKALLMSFPRDLYVEIPGSGQGKINTAFAKGGPALAIQTVETLTDVRIDHYIEVNFNGFRRMVDALDGVEVCLPKAAKEKDSGIDLPAGRSVVKGPQALAFVRQRKGLPRGDIDRIARQQQFLAAMLRRATSRGILLRLDRVLPFLKTVTDSIQVDEHLSFNTMKDLALRLKDLDPAKVTFVTVPIDKLGRRNGQSVVLMDELGAEQLFRSIREDDAIPGASAAPSGPPSNLIVAPSRIRVRVLNGAGIKGLAAKAAEDLRGVGFKIVDTGNADSEAYEETIVRHGPDREDSARTLAAAVPGARTQLDQSMRGNVELVVGRHYSGARQVTISAPTTAPPVASGGPAPSTPVKSAADDPCT
jgi:LCP family protein required for cell wall assembly